MREKRPLPDQDIEDRQHSAALPSLQSVQKSSKQATSASALPTHNRKGLRESRHKQRSTLPKSRERTQALSHHSEPTFPIRLNRYLALCGVGARRKADEYIAEGHVQINGEVETRMGVQVQADDVVLFKKESQRIFSLQLLAA